MQLYNKHVSCSHLQQTEPWNNSVSLRCAKASRWSASLSWKGLPSPFWPRVVIYIDIALTRCPICFKTTLQRWWAWWRNTSKTRASSTWTRTWDVFCDALAARFMKTSQVLVFGYDADVFILLFHHAHHLSDVIMELDVSGSNSWRCINISALSRKIGPRVSEISLFAVLWFRIDQRLLISTLVHISIPGISISGNLPRVHWLWLYNSFQWELREHAFWADDEWSGSSRCLRV